MTEEMWSESIEPEPMLHFLGSRISSRKSRLFAVACARRLWQFFSNDRPRRVVELLEQHADGQCSDEDVNAALVALDLFDAPPVDQVAAARFDRVSPTFVGENFAATFRTEDDARTSVLAALAAAEWIHHAARTALAKSGRSEQASWRSAVTLEQRLQCNLLRDIVGNPFHPIDVANSVRSVDALAVAKSIYADLAFDRMPILADALEDAGCANTAILDHCRQPGEHVRGCWVVDLVLGKE